jgi:hypothetical protein
MFASLTWFGLPIFNANEFPQVIVGWRAFAMAGSHKVVGHVLSKKRLNRLLAKQRRPKTEGFFLPINCGEFRRRSLLNYNQYSCSATRISDAAQRGMPD